jgi:hypothetical protein
MSIPNPVSGEDLVCFLDVGSALVRAGPAIPMYATIIPSQSMYSIHVYIHAYMRQRHTSCVQGGLMEKDRERGGARVVSSRLV